MFTPWKKIHWILQMILKNLSKIHIKSLITISSKRNIEENGEIMPIKGHENHFESITLFYIKKDVLYIKLKCFIF